MLQFTEEQNRVLTEEQRQKLQENHDAILDQRDAAIARDSLRISMAKDAAENVAYGVELMRQFVAFDPTSGLGARTKSLLEGVSRWQSDFEKELQLFSQNQTVKEEEENEESSGV